MHTHAHSRTPGVSPCPCLLGAHGQVLGPKPLIPTPPALGLRASVSPRGVPTGSRPDAEPPLSSPEGTAGPCVGPHRASVSPAVLVLGARVHGCCNPFPPPRAQQSGGPQGHPELARPGGSSSACPATPVNFWDGKSHSGDSELRPAPLITRVGRAPAAASPDRSPVAPGLRGAAVTRGVWGVWGGDTGDSHPRGPPRHQPLSYYDSGEGGPATPGNGAGGGPTPLLHRRSLLCHIVTTATPGPRDPPPLRVPPSPAARLSPTLSFLPPLLLLLLSIQPSSRIPLASNLSTGEGDTEHPAPHTGRPQPAHPPARPRGSPRGAARRGCWGWCRSPGTSKPPSPGGKASSGLPQKKPKFKPKSPPEGRVGGEGGFPSRYRGRLKPS